jgi:N,N'-diacetyllegionaminate synthase
MRIGDFDTSERVFIIAEVGNNHEGDFSLATQLIHAAARSGADAVKFQTIAPEQLVSATEEARVAQLNRFAFTDTQFAQLAREARAAGVLFLSTPFYLDAVSMLDPHVPAFKIASGDNNFFALHDAIARTGKPVILSTGFADLSTIQDAVTRIAATWDSAGTRSELALLHCVSSYPVPPAEANLRAIATLSASFPDATIGYSDHTIGIDAAVASVALGACIIEKHFTIDKQYSDFHDHQLSADPDDLAALVTRVRAIEEMLGDGWKEVQAGEAANAIHGRRSIAAARALAPGHVITAEDLTWVRPGSGLPPGDESRIIGKSIRHPKAFGEHIHPEDLVA